MGAQIGIGEVQLCSEEILIGSAKDRLESEENPTGNLRALAGIEQALQLEPVGVLLVMVGALLEIVGILIGTVVIRK